MNDYVAEALMNIGKNLPVQLRQNRLDRQNEEDRKRQMMSDDVALELSKMNLQSAKDKDTEDQAAKTAVEDATRGIQRQKQFSDLNALEEMYGMPKGDYNILSNRDVAINSNVPSFSGNDRTKEFMSTFVEKPEDQISKETALTANLGQKDQELEMREKLANLKNEFADKLNDEKFSNQWKLLEERLKAMSDEKEKDREAKKTANSLNPDERTSNAQNVIDKIDLLDKHPGFKSSVGLKGLTRLGGLVGPIPGSKDAGFNAEYNALRSMLTMENIGKLKGVLSDTDMKILTQAASSLDLNMPEKDFRNEMKRVRSVMETVKNSGATGNTDNQTSSSANNYLDEIRARRKALNANQQK